jgi:hypothetical protein
MWPEGSPCLLGDEDAVDLVDLDELHLDALVAGGGQVLADVVGTDRKLAVAAVGKDGELHPLRTAVAEERLDRGPDRAAGVEDVVDEHTRHALEREIERGRADERLRVPRRLSGANVDVVTVEGDVELAEGDLGPAQLGDAVAQPLGERHTARVDADERDALEVWVALEDLVRDPRQRALDRLGVENGLGFRGLRAGGVARDAAFRTLGLCPGVRLKGPVGPLFVRGSATQGALRALLTFDSFPASRDRVKGACVGARL